MKAERIQTQIPDLPGWNTHVRVTIERQLQFPSLQHACLFATRVAKQMAEVEEAPMVNAPQVDIRGGEVTLRLVAEQPEVLDAEVALIDRLIPLAEAVAAQEESHDDPLPTV